MVGPVALPDLLGTIPQWITAGGVASLVWAFVWRQVGLRKIESEDTIAQRKADSEEAAGIRAHWAEELERMARHQKEIDDEHEECRRERDELRRRLSGVEDKLTGLARQFVAFQLETAKAIPPERWTLPMQEALNRLSDIAGVNLK